MPEIFNSLQPKNGLLLRDNSPNVGALPQRCPCLGRGGRPMSAASGKAMTGRRRALNVGRSTRSLRSCSQLSRRSLGQCLPGKRFRPRSPTNPATPARGSGSSEMPDLDPVRQHFGFSSSFARLLLGHGECAGLFSCRKRSLTVERPASLRSGGFTFGPKWCSASLRNAVQFGRNPHGANGASPFSTHLPLS